MTVETAEGRKDIETEKELIAAFEFHRDHGYAQFVLHGDNGDYLSAIGEGFGPFTLEWFPAGRAGTHHRALEELKSQEVMTALLAFYRRGSEWRESLPWQEVEDERPSLLVRLFKRLLGWPWGQ